MRELSLYRGVLPKMIPSRPTAFKFLVAARQCHCKCERIPTGETLQQKVGNTVNCLLRSLANRKGRDESHAGKGITESEVWLSFVYHVPWKCEKEMSAYSTTSPKSPPPWSLQRVFHRRYFNLKTPWRGCLLLTFLSTRGPFQSPTPLLGKRPVKAHHLTPLRAQKEREK